MVIKYRTYIKTDIILRNNTEISTCASLFTAYQRRVTLSMHVCFSSLELSYFIEYFCCWTIRLCNNQQISFITTKTTKLYPELLYTSLRYDSHIFLIALQCILLCSFNVCSVTRNSKKYCWIYFVRLLV